MYLCVLLLIEIEYFFSSKLASPRTLLSSCFTVVPIPEESGGDSSDVVTVFYSCADS